MLKKILLALTLLLASPSQATNLPISSLPLGTAATTGTTDSMPYTNVSAGQPYRLKLSDLPNLPAFQTEFGVLQPITTLGDLIYGNSTPAPARLPGNTTVAKEFLSQTGTGTASAAPVWGVLASGDIPNNAANTSGTAAGLSQALTSGLPIIGNGTGIAAGTKSGSTTEFGTVSGSTTTNDCVKFDASGNLVDAGAACGSGSGGTPGGSNTQVQFNNSSAFGGSSGLTWNGTALTAAQIIDSGLTVSTPVIANSSGQLTSGTYSGNTTKLATVNGSLTSGDCLQADANGNVQTTGAACGSGGGGITALTGDVTASGTGSVAATLAATTNSTLATLSGLTTAGSLATVGTIGTGVWHGTAIGATYGGTGISTASSTGVPSISSGTWSVGATLTPALGGTGLATGSSTGVPSISSGTWSVNTTLPTSLGGLGGAFGSSTGALSISSGTVSAGTLGYANGGTNATSQTQAQANMSTQTTKGDIQTYSTVPIRHGVPGDYGALIPDSQQTDGYRNATYTQTLNGKPGKNYIQYADFENNSVTTGWSLGTTGTLTNGLPTGTPTFGSGASGNLSTNVYTPALAGAYSLRYFSSIATTAGNMLASSSYAIDPEDQAQTLGVKFYYSATSGATNANWSGTSSNSMAWAVYDVTNSAWLSSWGNFCFQQSSGTGICNGGFQTAPTTANIRFVVYNANATSGLFGIALDDFYVGPISTPQGYAGTDDLSYSATVSGVGTATGIITYWSRRGDKMYLRGNFSTGTVAASQFQISLPSGYTIDSTKVGTTGNLVVGLAVPATNGTIVAVSLIANGGNSYLQGGALGASLNLGLTPSNGSSLFNSSTAVTFHAEVPISGWSSNTQVSSDSSSTVIAAQYNTLSSTTITSGTALNFTTVAYDTNGALSGGAFKAPQTGIYDVGIGGFFTTSASLNMSLYVNGSSRVANMITVNGTYRLSATAQVQMNAGDSLTVVPGASATASDTNGYFWVKKNAGSNAVQAPPTVAFDYYGSSTSITTSNAILVQPTKLVDTMNIYNTTTGLATAPYTGTYHCDCRALVTFSGNGYVMSMQFVVAGTAIGAQGTSSNVSETSVSIGDDFTVLAGQTIGCQAGASASATGTYNSSFACHRLGY